MCIRDILYILWPNKAENEIIRPMYIYKIHDFSKNHVEKNVLHCVFLEKHITKLNVIWLVVKSTSDWCQ